jgi:hypothetical protein
MSPVLATHYPEKQATTARATREGWVSLVEHFTSRHSRPSRREPRPPRNPRRRRRNRPAPAWLRARRPRTVRLAPLRLAEPRPNPLVPLDRVRQSDPGVPSVVVPRCGRRRKPRIGERSDHDDDLVRLAVEDRRAAIGAEVEDVLTSFRPVRDPGEVAEVTDDAHSIRCEPCLHPEGASRATGSDRGRPRSGCLPLPGEVARSDRRHAASPSPRNPADVVRRTSRLDRAARDIPARWRG